MDFRGFTFPSVLGRLRDDAPAPDADNDPEQATDGGVVTVEGKAGTNEVPVPPGADVVISVPDGHDVDRENIERGLDDVAAERTVMVEGQTNDGDGMTVNPIAESDTQRLGGHFSEVWNEFDRIDDTKIQKLRDNRVDYNERVGKWILTADDRVPAILNNQVGLILGQEGLTVEPEDPDNEADVRTAEFLRERYNDDHEELPGVDPGDVVRSIMAQNYMAARSVVRSTDLADLPLESLTYYRDPEDSTEYYLQDEVTYKKLIVDDDGQGWSTERKTTEEQLLELGEHVFDAHLFRSKPLKSIADLVVNKMVLQRLMARKAEIASVGGLYITVKPPDWLQESEYHDTVEDPENPDETIDKLELHMREGVNNAFSTLEDYQSGFIMSIPSHWEVNQIEVPDTGEAMEDQIRAYNKSIAARLLFPLDLMELREGAELSRDTLFRTLLNTIAGWRREVLAVFDDFARVQKEIHGLNGDVKHSLPKLESEDEELLIQALNFAGLAGLSSKEVRQVFNRIEGFDLDEQPDGQPPGQQGPPPGGPGGQNREQSMREILDEQRENEQDPSPDGEGDEVEAAARAAVDSHDTAVDVAAAIPDDFGVEVFRVTADPDDDTEYADSPLGVGVDFPSGGVYVDWNLEAFPDPLDDPHVSVYRTVEDFQKASGNVVEYVTDDSQASDPSRRDVLEAAKFTPPEGLDLHELDGWDQTSVWRAFLSLGGRHRTCSKRMATEVRNADAWCAALKDQALGTDLWRKGSGAFAGGDAPDPTVYAQEARSFDFGGSLDDFASTVESVLEDNLDSDVTRLQSEDDYVAFSPGGVDPTEDDADGFSPIVVVDAGDSGFQISGASSGALDGLESELGKPPPARSTWTATWPTWGRTNW